MKNMTHKPATPLVQAKTRRRAHAAQKRETAHGAGLRAGSAFFLSLFLSARGSRVAGKLKTGYDASRADIRKIVARGAIVEAPFAGDDERREEFTATKRARRLRAILAQHARRLGLHEVGAEIFDRRRPL